MRALPFAVLLLAAGCDDPKPNPILPYGGGPVPLYDSPSAMPQRYDTTRDHDCSDFDSQHDAQVYYESIGGPEEDRDRLDADRNGTACESLR